MNANDRSITGFVMAGHAMVHTYEMSIPILMTIWLLEFSTTAAALGLAVTVGYGLFGVGALPGGILADRFGSRRLIVAGLAGMGLSFLLVSAARGIVTLALALGVWGAAASVYHPAGLALISNGVERRGAAFAYHGMAGNVGIAFGPLATALLLLAFDWRLVAVALAVPAFAAAAVGTAIEFDETAAVEPTASDGGREPPGSLAEFVAETRRVFTLGFLAVFVVVMFEGLYYRGMLTFLPQLLDGFLATVAGDLADRIAPDGPVGEEFDLAQYVYVGLLTVGIGGQYLGGKLTERIAPEKGFAIVLAILAGIALAFAPAAEAGLATLLGVTVALGIALFAVQPLSQATIAKYSAADTRGISFGFTYLGIFGVGALGATVTGTVLTYGSVAAVFVVLAGFATIGCALAAVLSSQDDWR